MKNVLRARQCEECVEGWAVLKNVLRAGQCEECVEGRAV